MKRGLVQLPVWTRWHRVALPCPSWLRVTVNTGSSARGDHRKTLEGGKQKVIPFGVPAVEEPYSGQASEFLPTNLTEGGLGMVFFDLHLSLRKQPGLIPPLIH